MGVDTRVKTEGGETVTVTGDADLAPATVHRVFAHVDVPDAAARRVADWFARHLAGLEIESIRIRPPDPMAWYERQTTAAYPANEHPSDVVRERDPWSGFRPDERRPYPLARVLVRYPSFVPPPGVLRWLLVELPDGRVVPGGSDEAEALLGRARVFWRIAKGCE